MKAVEVSLSTGSFWNTVSDHRRLDITLTSPLYDIGVTPQAATQLPPSLARIDLVSTTEPEYVAKFHELLAASLADIPRLPTNDHQLSTETLRMISTASCGCVPRNPDSRLCEQKY